MYCEHCGAVLVSDHVAAKLPPKQRALFEAVQRSGTAGITSSAILDQMYQFDPNGGPKSANIVNVVTSNVNKKIAGDGLRIEGKRGPLGSFRLVRF